MDIPSNVIARSVLSCYSVRGRDRHAVQTTSHSQTPIMDRASHLTEVF